MVMVVGWLGSTRKPESDARLAAEFRRLLRKLEASLKVERLGLASAQPSL